jgi:hypothetical protein
VNLSVGTYVPRELTASNFTAEVFTSNYSTLSYKRIKIHGKADVWFRTLRPLYDGHCKGAQLKHTMLVLLFLFDANAFYGDTIDVRQYRGNRHVTKIDIQQNNKKLPFMLIYTHCS